MLIGKLFTWQCDFQLTSSDNEVCPQLATGVHLPTKLTTQHFVSHTKVTRIPYIYFTCLISWHFTHIVGPIRERIETHIEPIHLKRSIEAPPTRQIINPRTSVLRVHSLRWMPFLCRSWWRMRSVPRWYDISPREYSRSPRASQADDREFTPVHSY